MDSLSDSFECMNIHTPETEKDEFYFCADAATSPQIISPEPESEVEFINASMETIHESITEMNGKVQKNYEFLQDLFMKCEQIKKEILLEENSENCLSAIKEIVNCIPEKLPKVPQLLLGKMENKSKAQKCNKMKESDLWKEITETYKASDAEPGQSVTPPQSGLTLDVNTLEQITPMIKNDNQILNHLENYNLRNAYRLGWWLNIAFAIFQTNKKYIGVPSFKEWCQQAVNIKESKQRDLRNLANLIDKVPKLIRCHLPISFFTKNNKAIMELVTTIPVFWTHELSCSCEQCMQMS